MRWLLKTLLAFTLLALCFETYSQEKRATVARVIFLTQHGFDPPEVSVKPGPVWLIVRSKVPGNHAFELTATSRKLPEALLSGKNRKVAREVVTLTPGEYELSDPRYPQWKCRVRVQP